MKQVVGHGGVNGGDMPKSGEPEPCQLVGRITWMREMLIRQQELIQAISNKVVMIGGIEAPSKPPIQQGESKSFVDVFTSQLHQFEGNLECLQEIYHVLGKLI